jgi:hypothetical protein
MPKAYALLAGSGVGTPAVRTFLDLDSTADGGALLHALWRAHRVQGVGLAAGASSSGAVLITSDPHRSRLPFAPHAFDLVRAPSALRNASALFELDRVVARFLEIAARLRWARHQFGVFKGEHREINLRFEKRGGRGS